MIPWTFAVIYASYPKPEVTSYWDKNEANDGEERGSATVCGADGTDETDYSARTLSHTHNPDTVITASFFTSGKKKISSRKNPSEDLRERVVGRRCHTEKINNNRKCPRPGMRNTATAERSTRFGPDLQAK